MVKCLSLCLAINDEALLTYNDSFMPIFTRILIYNCMIISFSLKDCLKFGKNIIENTNVQNKQQAYDIHLHLLIIIKQTKVHNKNYIILSLSKCSTFIL